MLKIVHLRHRTSDLAHPPQSILPSHHRGAEVGVTAAAVPVSLHGFRVQRCDKTKVLTHTVQQEACHPQVITHLYPLAWPHLELPLGVRGHHRANS